MKHPIWTGIAAALLACGGCNVADLEHAPDPVFDGPISPPPGTAKWSKQTYVEALRSASLKVRGLNADAADVDAVLADGRTAYEAAIDRYLDASTSANDVLAARMQVYFRNYFSMGGSTVTVLDPGGTPVDVNMNEPANLAAYIVAHDLPWSEILEADYCVNDALQIVACTNPMPVDLRAGVLTNQAFLRQYGQADTLNFRRLSVTAQMLTCHKYPTGDVPLVRSNSESSQPDSIPVADDPADPPRVHKAFQGMMGSTSCAGCHGGLLSRRPAFLHFDTDGFYDPTRRILDVETPALHSGMCYVVPPGRTLASLPSCEGFVPGSDTCCRDDFFTDYNSWDAQNCNDPATPCTGVFMGESFQTTRDYAEILLDGSVTNDAFTRCATQRLYDFVLGVPDLRLGLGASEGDLPAAPPTAVLTQYRTLFEHDNQNIRELLRALLKSDSFLNAQTL